MDKSTVHDKFDGYNAHPLGISEGLVRGKLIELFDKIINKNETCLIKARDRGMEKLFSRILAVKKRMDRIKNEMERASMNANYKMEMMPQEDESAVGGIDLALEKSILQASDIIDSLTCMETDMHISDKFAMIENSLREIEQLFHQRKEIFNKMRVRG